MEVYIIRLHSDSITMFVCGCLFRGCLWHVVVQFTIWTFFKTRLRYGFEIGHTIGRACDISSHSRKILVFCKFIPCVYFLMGGKRDLFNSHHEVKRSL